jgi:ribosome-binding ATPase YchF (GTP1/OBG family)
VKEAVAEQALLQKLETELKAGKMVGKLELNKEEKAILKGLHLLTAKPLLYVLNSSAASENVVTDFANLLGSKVVKVDAIFGEGLDDLIKASYELLGLITYFTTGPDETRAWTIERGWAAPEAGTAIHGDFKDKFIKAEVQNWEKLIAGAKMETKGKEYIVQDGDVIEFKI